MIDGPKNLFGKLDAHFGLTVSYVVILRFYVCCIIAKQTKFMHPYHIAGIASDSWGIAMQMPWQFEKEGGGIRQRVPGRDAFYATMFEYKALECCLPNRNLFIKGVSVTDEASRF